MGISAELDLVLRQPYGPDTDYLRHLTAGRLSDWEIRQMIWRHLGHHPNYDDKAADAIADGLVEPLEDLLREGKAPRGGFGDIVRSLTAQMTSHELIGLAKDLGLGDRALPDGTTLNSLAKRLKPMVGGVLVEALDELTNRWREDGNFELKTRRRRDRRLEPIGRPYVPPSTQDAQRMR
jgi:hypothetical protein